MIANRALRRRVAVGFVVAATVGIAPITAGLEAGASTQAPLGSVNVSAVATGIREPFYSHQGEDAEIELPYSLSQLGAGGVGHAVTSLIWPGSTGASLGSTLAVLGLPGVPASLENSLNDPLKAEAPTTTGKTSVSLSNPGVIMQALALPTHVNASSAFGPSSLSSFKDDAGPLVSATTNILQGTSSVVIDARAAITDFGIGPLTIGSIVSTAHATSDGTKATGTTQTQITGVQIAGVGVSIDANGVEISDKGALPASLLTTLNKTVNSALKAAGMQIYLAQASKSVHGSQVSLDSGDLIVSLKKAGYKSGLNDTGTLIELGGASITANASQGYVPPTTPVTSITTPPSTSSGGQSSFGPPPDLGPGTTTLPISTQPPALAANPLSLPGALSAWWIVGGLLLALIAAFLLGMLPGRALDPGAVCLEEDA